MNKFTLREIALNVRQHRWYCKLEGSSIVFDRLSEINGTLYLEQLIDPCKVTATVYPCNFSKVLVGNGETGGVFKLSQILKKDASLQLPTAAEMADRAQEVQEKLQRTELLVVAKEYFISLIRAAANKGQTQLLFSVSDGKLNLPTSTVGSVTDNIEIGVAIYQDGIFRKYLTDWFESFGYSVVAQTTVTNILCTWGIIWKRKSI